MVKCERCGAVYQGKLARCPLDRGALVELQDPGLGATLGGRYTLLALLGESPLSLVYEARDGEPPGGKVAVKVLRSGVSRSPRLRERFLRESSLTGLLHPNIVRLLGRGQGDDGALFLVMERLEGEPLSARMSRPLTARQIVELGGAVAGALAFAHDKGIVHRDLKPTNIFLAREGGQERVKLLDFGLAKVFSEVALTVTGELCGTPHYMAPEQIENSKNVSTAADMYALGVVLYEMLAGRPPFLGPTSAVLEAHLTEPPVAPSVHRDADPTLSRLALDLLDKNPDARPSAEQTRQRLEEVAGKMG